MDLLGIGYAVNRAVDAVKGGIVREQDGQDFACWIADEYRDESESYVDSIPTSTLRDRFLSR